MASGSNAEETGKDFGGKMKQMFTNSCTGLGIALGVSTGLLEKMASWAEPKTSHQIADEMGMKERYIREWLGIMVCADIIDLDATSEETFFLPYHRRSYFTPGCMEQGVSLMFRCLPMLAQSFDVLGKCFLKDGPIGFPGSVFNYSPEMSHVRFRHSLIKELETILDLKNLESGISVLDLGCGVGVSTRVLAEHFPKSRFIGLDHADDVIKEAQIETANQKLENVEFTCASAMDMDRDWTDKFDIFFIYDMVHATSRPEKVLQECLRVLKPGGMGVIFEPSMFSSMAENAKIPGNSCRYTFGLFRCVPNSIVDSDSPGLGPAWGKENIREMLEKTGFKIISIEGQAATSPSWIFVCEKPEQRQ